MVEGDYSEEEVKEELVDVFTLECHFTKEELTYIKNFYLKLMEKRPYWMRSQYELDKGTFVRLVCPPLTDDIASKLFDSFIDNKENQHMKLEQFIAGFYNITRGDEKNRYQLIAQMFDSNKDGKIEKEDIISLVRMQRKFLLYVRPKKTRARK